MLHRHSYWPEPLDLVALAALRGTYGEPKFRELEPDGWLAAVRRLAQERRVRIQIRLGGQAANERGGWTRIEHCAKVR